MTREVWLNIPLSCEVCMAGRLRGVRAARPTAVVCAPKSPPVVFASESLLRTTNICHATLSSQVTPFSGCPGMCWAALRVLAASAAATAATASCGAPSPPAACACRAWPVALVLLLSAAARPGGLHAGPQGHWKPGVLVAGQPRRARKAPPPYVCEPLSKCIWSNACRRPICGVPQSNVRGCRLVALQDKHRSSALQHGMVSHGNAAPGGYCSTCPAGTPARHMLCPAHGPLWPGRDARP